MKKLLLALVLIATGNSTFCQIPMYKKIPYNDSSATSITVIKPDQDEHVLFAGVTDSSGSPVVQKIGLNGVVKWKYSLKKGDAKDKSSARIIDIFHSAKDEYMVCINRFGKRRASGSSAEILVLDSNGHDLRTHFIDPEKNPYSGNLNVQKCWEHASSMYTLGSIFGGSSFDRKLNHGSVYWIQVLNSDRQQILSKFIPSTLRFRSDFVDVLHVGDDIFAVATNGQDSEIVKINTKSGDFFQAKIAGVARLISGTKELKFLVKTVDGFNIQIFNATLTPNLKQKINILATTTPIAAYSIKDGGIAIVYHEIAGDESKLISQEINSLYQVGKNTVLGAWRPPVVFSTASSHTLRDEVILQFYQEIKDKNVNYSNNIFKIYNIK